MREPETNKYRDLVPGDRFHSPREDEGIVTVVCAPGNCEHDRSRDEYGCHVRASDGGQFFVNWDPSWEVTMAEKPSWLR